MSKKKPAPRASTRVVTPRDLDRGLDETGLRYDRPSLHESFALAQQQERSERVLKQLGDASVAADLGDAGAALAQASEPQVQPMQGEENWLRITHGPFPFVDSVNRSGSESSSLAKGGGVMSSSGGSSSGSSKGDFNRGASRQERPSSGHQRTPTVSPPGSTQGSGGERAVNVQAAAQQRIQQARRASEGRHGGASQSATASFNNAATRQAPKMSPTGAGSTMVKDDRPKPQLTMKGPGGVVVNREAHLQRLSSEASAAKQRAAAQRVLHDAKAGKNLPSDGQKGGHGRSRK